MERHTLSLLAPLCAAFIVTGCATTAEGDYPDLAPRAIEGRLTTVPPEPVPLPPPPPPAASLSERLAQLSSQADNAIGRFDVALPATTQLVDKAAGANVSSEAWIAAQTAISVLDSERGPVTDALADIDALIIANADVADGAGQTQLSDMRDRLTAVVASQRKTVQGLLARLKPA